MVHTSLVHIVQSSFHLLRLFFTLIFIIFFLRSFECASMCECLRICDAICLSVRDVAVVSYPVWRRWVCICVYASKLVFVYHCPIYVLFMYLEWRRICFFFTQLCSPFFSSFFSSHPSASFSPISFTTLPYYYLSFF